LKKKKKRAGGVAQAIELLGSMKPKAAKRKRRKEKKF
jgi:hypothetical protein